MSINLHEEALSYHRDGRPGKIQVSSHKKLDNELELSLAYSPGVAAPVREIVKDPTRVNEFTIKGNLVAVITDGSAVLGLGNVGPLAAKPVMEGKAVYLNVLLVLMYLILSLILRMLMKLLKLLKI